jgi:hypothetical protein
MISPRGVGVWRVGFPLVFAAACLSERLGPEAFRLTVSPHAVTFDALEDTLRVQVARFDSHDAPLSTSPVTFASTTPAVASVDPGGFVVSRGNGTTWILARGPSGAADSVAVTVAQQVTRVEAAQDTVVLDALGAEVPLQISAVDRLGSNVSGVALRYSVSDSTVVVVNPGGSVRAIANGWTTVTGATQGESVSVAVQVAQRPVRVLVPSDTLLFVALGETQRVVGIAVDSLGSAMSTPVRFVTVEDTTVLRVVDSVTVRSISNGVTAVQFAVGGLPKTLTGRVVQIPDTILAALDSGGMILSAALDSLIPLTCHVLDRNGHEVSVTASAVAVRGGLWSGNHCGALVAVRSGFDTLVLTAGPALSTLPLVLAVRPIVTGLQPLALDSLPVGTGPWAPTLRRAPDGSLELYVAAYRIDPTAPLGQGPGDLHRLISSDDGQSFRYDDVVLQHDSELCSPNGSGIENVDIVPRSDGSGWRMFYASGSFTCYGWQVFSATSPDGHVWSKEGAVRLSNGGSTSQDSTTIGPWPVGEGIVTEQLPTGGWRMLTGGYDHLVPAAGKFQIVEWRSPDQLNWTFLEPVLTTDQLPPEAERSVYGETIREITPGLWRMLFTADDLDRLNGRSRLWSAVSVDGVTWQSEGELIGVPGEDFFYATIAGDRLVTIKGLGLATRRLYTARIDMP